jgi:hypothetical protein
MMKTDTLEASREAAARINDPRLTTFRDPQHQLGCATARCLGWKQHAAWDTYFIYRAGTHWMGQEMPVPELWHHQLKDREVWERMAAAEFGSTEWTQALAKKSEADPAHFATGDALRIALAEGVALASSRT